MSRPPAKLRRGRSLSRRTAGARGEDFALRYLIEQGYEVVKRTYRTRFGDRFGELDLILRRANTLVFVLLHKAIPRYAAHVQGVLVFVGRHFDREPEHLVDVVMLLGA